MCNISLITKGNNYACCQTQLSTSICLPSNKNLTIIGSTINENTNTVKAAMILTRLLQKQISHY